MARLLIADDPAMLVISMDQANLLEAIMQRHVPCEVPVMNGFGIVSGTHTECEYCECIWPCDARYIAVRMLTGE